MLLTRVQFLNCQLQRYLIYGKVSSELTLENCHQCTARRKILKNSQKSDIEVFHTVNLAAS